MYNYVYRANRGTGYKAAAVVIEDFSPNYAEPVGLQFLVFVLSSTNPALFSTASFHSSNITPGLMCSCSTYDNI